MNKQLELFELKQKKNLSNTLEFFDAIPRHVFNNAAVADNNEHTTRFSIDDKTLVVSVRAVVSARGKAKFPGEREQVVEEVLMYFATKGNGNIGKAEDGKPRVEVVTTKYAIQKELKDRKHSYSWKEIEEAIEVMQTSLITIKHEDGSVVQLKVLDSVGVNADGNTILQFNSLITKEIADGKYRPYDYEIAMALKPLERWVYKRLARKYTQADPKKKYHFFARKFIDASPIRHKRFRDRLNALKDVLGELQEKNLIGEFDCEPAYGGARNTKIVDAKMELWGSFESQRAMKKFNHITKDRKFQQAKLAA